MGRDVPVPSRRLKLWWPDGQRNTSRTGTPDRGDRIVANSDWSRTQQFGHATMSMTKVGEGIRFDPDAPAEPLRHLIAQRYPGELRRDGIEQAVERQGTRHDRALLPVVGGMTNQAEAVNEFLAACPPGEAEAVQRILNGVF